MATTLISVKIDEDLKKEVQEIAEELGFSLSSLIKASLKKIAREKGVSYKIEPDYNPDFVKSVLEAEKDALEGKNLLGPFSTDKELKDYFASIK